MAGIWLADHISMRCFFNFLGSSKLGVCHQERQRVRQLRV